MHSPRAAGSAGAKMAVSNNSAARAGSRRTWKVLHLPAAEPADVSPVAAEIVAPFLKNVPTSPATSRKSTMASSVTGVSEKQTW